MILTCPECATRYFVPDDSVGPDGRTVRCASCGNSWRAMPEAPLDLAPEQTASPKPPKPEVPELTPDTPGVAVPRVFRERAKAQQRLRESMTSGAVWAVTGGALFVLLVLAVLFRNDVVRAWPKTASAYALFGMRVNAVGLVIQEQSAQPGFEDGRPALRVAASIRNIWDRPISAPPLHLTLLDKEDQVLATQISRLTNPVIPAGEAREFLLTLQDPPRTTEAVEIRFELEGDDAASDHAGGLRQRAPVSEEHGDAAAEEGGGEEEAPAPALRPAAH